VRWPHPERCFLPPGEFIPLAESIGLILPLSRWVLATTLAQCRVWQEEGVPLRSLNRRPQTTQRTVRYPKLVRVGRSYVVADLQCGHDMGRLLSARYLPEQRRPQPRGCNREGVARRSCGVPRCGSYDPIRGPLGASPLRAAYEHEELPPMPDRGATLLRRRFSVDSCAPAASAG
jgi:hypothetical protein